MKHDEGYGLLYGVYLYTCVHLYVYLSQKMMFIAQVDLLQRPVKTNKYLHNDKMSGLLPTL